MNKLSCYLVLLVGLSVSACESIKTPTPTGGSRADGTINLSYEVRMFEKPVIDWAVANNTASQRCQAWGYTKAEPFGGQQSHCQYYNGYGNCTLATVTVTYQCIGGQQ